jgi:transcriptional regulator with XRE-family HTH domain
MDTLSNILKAYRKKHKITKKQLARHIANLPVRTLEKWESGEKEPTAWALQLIRNHLETATPPDPEMTKHEYKKTAALIVNDIATSYAKQTALINRAHEISMEGQ